MRWKRRRHAKRRRDVRRIRARIAEIERSFAVPRIFDRVLKGMSAAMTTLGDRIAQACMAASVRATSESRAPFFADPLRMPLIGVDLGRLDSETVLTEGRRNADGTFTITNTPYRGEIK